MQGNGLFKIQLSPESHPSLALSCADKLLWVFAEQILQERELAIAYPCLDCRGSLSVFLAYLAIAIEENRPGETPEPVLVYPSTAEIRQAYTALRVQVGQLLDALRRRRVRAGRECFVHRWEENVLRAIRRGRFDRTAEFPLHDFFPAAVLDESGSPRIFAGRDGFGRRDDAPPPLQFASAISRVSPRVRYRVAVIMHDAIESWSERQRVSQRVDGIRADSLLHLFESPYSPTFQKMMASGKRYWRLRPEDFSSEASPVPPDDEIQRVLEAQRRIHSIPSALITHEYRVLAENFKHLRHIARENSEAANAYSYLYNCYRLIATLPVPPEHFDGIADEFGFSTLSERVDEVKEIAEALGPGVAYSLIDESIQVLRSILDRVRVDPARARALLAEARRACRDRKRLGIAVSSPIFASAIERFLGTEFDCEPLSLRDKEIHVIEARSLPHLQPFDVLVFFGYRGAGALRWMMSGKAKEIVAILSEHERRAMARDLTTATRGRDSWRPQTAVPAATTTDGASSGQEEGDSDRSPSVTQLQQALGDPEQDLPAIPLDDVEFVRDILDYSPPVESGLGRAVSGTTIRTCRKVIFGDQFAYLPAEGSVTVLHAKGTTEKRVEDLEVGDVILFVDGHQRLSIYELMLAEIKKSPAFAVSGGIIEAWHRRLRAQFASSFMTIADLHRKLRVAGSQVVAATVGAWLRGSVMSPQDSENLGRLFLALGIPDPEGKHSRRIDQAARHLRNVYRQYARAVNAFLLRAAGDDRPELDALLQKYNLDIDAIREAVLAEEIEEISSGSVEVPASRTGRLYGR